MSSFGRSSRQQRGPEFYVQDAILDWLRAEHILAFRMQVGATKIDGRMLRFGVPGMADILAFPKRSGHPFPCWIECKAEDGRQSALQRSFQDQVEVGGHLYLLARSVDDVADGLRAVAI